MDKRVVLAIAGVTAILAVIWLTTRTDEPAPAAEMGLSAEAPVATTSDPVGGVPAPTVSVGATPPGTPATMELTVTSQRINVSPGFEWLSKPMEEMDDTDGRYLHWRRHQELQGEPRDEAWAPRMEAALRSGIEDGLTELGFDTQRIELPVLECRTTGCEIQALGYPVDSMKNGADLQLILSPLIEARLNDEFDPDGTSMLLSSRPDDRRAILVQLLRKKN
jgi:hypothetical protein